MMGCFLPLDKVKGVPVDLKKKFVDHLGCQIVKALSSQKNFEEEVLNDFRQFKKNRCRIRG